MSSNVNLQSILDNNKLTGLNFLDGLRNLKIVPMAEKIAYILSRPLPKSPPTDVSESNQNAYQKHIADSEIMSCIMLASMTTKI